jgi:hypothetical protein
MDFSFCASTITSKKLSGTLCNRHAHSVAPVQPIFVSHAALRVHEEVVSKAISRVKKKRRVASHAKPNIPKSHHAILDLSTEE